MTLSSFEAYILDKDVPLITRINTLLTKSMFNAQFVPLANKLLDSITPEESSGCESKVSLLRYSIKVRS